MDMLDVVYHLITKGSLLLLLLLVFLAWPLLGASVGAVFVVAVFLGVRKTLASQ